MAGLSKEALQIIEEASNSIDYGSIQVDLNASAKTVDITITNRIRVPKDDTPAPGRAVHSPGSNYHRG